MSYEKIQNLVEKLSCDFILASPEEPKTLSCLLPILKQIHSHCIKLSLKDQAKQVLNTRKKIDQILKNDPSDMDQNMMVLGDTITLLSSSFYEIQESEPIQTDDSTESDLDSPPNLQLDFSELENIELTLKKFSVLIGEFCPETIPDLGAMITCLYDLIEASTDKEYILFHEISIACKDYVENLTLENMMNTTPIEEGMVLLKSVLLHIKTKEEFVFDYTDVLELLAVKFNEAPIEAAEPIEPDPTQSDQEDYKPPFVPKEISPDDMEILTDFVSEAFENLDNIEVNLIELEQDPANKDIINDIFRPFHTIKGVSGFLALTKINTLAHATENLLDSARSGDFLINDTATDIILESVDTLKNLISGVEKGTQTGFMQDDTDIDVETLTEKLKKLQIALTTGKKQLLGEILVQKGEISSDNLDQALEIQKKNPEKKIGEILVEEKRAAPKQVAAALMDQNIVKRQVAAQVKVSTQKLDDLVDYAGELVIAQSMLRQKTSHDTSLTQSVSQLGQIVTNMQTIAMSMRMIPIKATFMKMIRLVRDLAKKSGKGINLNMEGEDTEIDRNVVDALYEPMVHMIRNSCDHGIEQKKDRIEQGKSSGGTIVLRAYHKGGHIIIEIEDDGKGLDKDVILAKAKEKELITGNEQFTDAQVYDMILQPGFSTAKQVTDVSGRGVGMDVVKSGIEKFRGHLSIESTKGTGTKFTISLPLTLAIIDGMLVGVDNEKYVIPTTAIQKAFKPKKDECFTVKGKGEMVKDRGDLIPVIRLNDLYNSSSERKVIWDNLVVVVESKEEKRALLIDDLLGKDEFVIKSLGGNLGNVKGLSGGAILSDGRVGLILDIHGVFQVANG
ncbi:MAG: chemotaxis protein CheA [Desulfobacula sp.]|nr:chemotaxis protein CheA [Desulfobacula sp.]